MIPFRPLALAFALTLAIMPTLGRAADPAPALTAEQSAAVDKLIHDYLLNNPKVMLEALERADAAAKADEANAARDEIVKRRDELDNDPTSPVIGNAKGDVTIVEFFDYRCPYCKATAPTVEQLLDEDKGIRLVLKDYPILGKDSVFASRAALAVAKHGKYAEFYKAMFALKTPVDETSTLGVVKAIGLDPVQVKKEMEASEIDVILKHNYELGRAVGADGTPAYVIGGSISAGALTGEELRAKIAAVRAKQPT
jgi:protein-disulfide isomerase